ncbi:MAG: hypothetical protein RIR00_1252 [Pseudomonadota bacterium]|jgi:hypothetical protein
MNPGGSLNIRARWQGGTLDALEVRLQRPEIGRLFHGQNPAAIPKTIPFLYSLCAQAQRLAAETALALASERPLRPLDPEPLWWECLHENLWRLLLDWPQALGLEPAREAFARWRNSPQGERRAATVALITGPLAETAAAIDARLGPLPACDGTPPALAPETQLARWQAGDPKPPAWATPGDVASAFATRLAAVRHAANRYVAAAPYPLAGAGGLGWGLAQTWTARGVLSQGLQLKDGQVRQFRIWAPTDCHFADSSALLRLLHGRSYTSAEAARRGLEQAILALDPCLPHTLEIHHA